MLDTDGYVRRTPESDKKLIELQGARLRILNKTNRELEKEIMLEKQKSRHFKTQLKRKTKEINRLKLILNNIDDYLFYNWAETGNKEEIKKIIRGWQE